MPLSPIQRSVYKSLLRRAKDVEGSVVLPHFYCSAMMLAASAELREVVRNEVERWGMDGGGDVQQAVRGWARRGNTAIGLEGCKILSMLKVMQSCDMTPFKDGDVVRHRVFGDVGVVVARHTHCTMGKAWLTRNMGSPSHPFSSEPWYDIVLDQQHGGFTRHGAHRNHEVVRSKVNHPVLQSEGWHYDPSAGKYTPPSRG
eukprot:TRINITY_DN30822_c0_g1_i1.p1 TRINITY_DN30822_c0_g1~~TRINITY_DN30822_c0_g1_i1.p1  ORF type:complete len:200 (+),score=18.32 TRINITY_DN30822_c0_g1_i1:88-687(+)